MSDVKYHPIALPSQGVLYGDQIPGGEVGVRPMTVNEEAEMQSQGASATDRVDRMLRACVQLPNGFKHEDLLASDRLVLLLAIRTVTFKQAEYGFQYKCPECGAQQRYAFDIMSELNEVTAEDVQAKIDAERAKRAETDPDYTPEPWVWEEPFELYLPDCEKKIGLRLQRGFDEDAIAKVKKREMMAKDKGQANAQSSYLHQFIRLIVTVDGEKVNTPQKDALLRSMTSYDSGLIREFIDKIEPGIDMTVYPECRNCGFVSDMKMPLNDEFFRPARLST